MVGTSNKSDPAAWPLIHWSIIQFSTQVSSAPLPQIMAIFKGGIPGEFSAWFNGGLMGFNQQKWWF